MRSEARLDNAFLALSHPIRRAMLRRLAKGEATVGQLGGPHGVSAPAITKHLRILRRAGLVTVKPRGHERRIRVRAEPLHEASQWIDFYRKFWDDRLDRVADVLQEMQP
jgi:DNA-binding transcriptional ArsR family regulator